MVTKHTMKMSLAELKALAKANWTNLTNLIEIDQELRYRTGPEDVNFHVLLDSQIRRLQSNSQHHHDARGDSFGQGEQSSEAPKRSGKASFRDTEVESSVKRMEAKLAEHVRRIGNLEEELRTACIKVSSLQKELSLNSKNTDSGTYGRVGLTANCPNFLIKAARTAYRKRLHPDSHSDRDKAEAHRRFVEAEAVFEEIYKTRKL